MQINAFLLDSPVSNSPRHPLVVALAAILFLESALITAATIYLVIEILISPAGSFVSGVALAVVAGIAAVWVAIIAVNVLRGNAWVRGASIVVQVLIAAVAVGSFQGEAALPVLGIALLVPVVLVLVLLFAKPVVAATSKRDA